MMKIKNQYRVIGVMSGTSMDGLDIALCTFQWDGRKWHFSIEKGITCPYSDDLKMKLTSAETCSGNQLLLIHNDFGKYIGNQILQFLNGTHQNIDLISSHGHTIFHQPDVGMTYQIGNGAAIASTTGISTVCDFRSLDVALGGQGAPLVPIGDKLLFSNYRYCLNLGGFANISFDDNQGARVAFDICPVNILLNHLAKEKGLEYDLNGSTGRSGVIINELLSALDELDFYKLPGPKSLGKEWVWSELLPVLQSFSLSTEDKMRTFYQHIANQITRNINTKNNGSLLITGGGAWNTFLIELIREQKPLPIEIPLKEIIDYKEALIFAFLGLLRYRSEINCLCSVTGATRDSSCGIIYVVDH